MKSPMHIRKSFPKTGLIILLIVVACIVQTETSAQVTINPATIKLDPNSDKKPAKGILTKIVQPIKFKSNRNSTENDRIFKFLNDQINNKQLKIDSATVNQIMIQFDTLVARNSSTKAGIKSIIETHNLDKKANKSVIDSLNKLMDASFDSLRTKMSIVLQENSNNNSQEKRELLSKNNNILKDVRDVQYSAASNLAETNSYVKKDTIYFFKRCLNPKIKVIGWQSPEMNDEFKNYNYNYLSAINLTGYSLSASGENNNPEDIRKFQAQGGIIELAQSKGCDIHLTVYNQSPTDIKKFLGDNLAQKTLIIELDTLIRKSKLKGINIYFGAISDPTGFVRFIKTLRENLRIQNKAIQLNVTIPAIMNNDVSLKKISGYNFSELNSLVDYYFVMTDKITDSENGIAQSSSPLLNSDKYGKSSIESTIGLYANGKIPISKLIMTVSYTGTLWQVDNFEGNPPNSKIDKDITYKDIIKDYLNKTPNKSSVIQGFDPDQIATYLNIMGPNPTDKNQIWYEDFRSLYLKYNWAQENGLGGVCIKGIGEDDGYSELWDAIGASLIRIDTIRVDKKHVISKPALTLSYYINLFIEDFQWAMEAKLNYKDPKAQNSICECDYSPNYIKTYRNAPSLWTDYQDYDMDNVNTLENSLLCNYLWVRWEIYSIFSKWCGIICILLFLIVWGFSSYLARYKLSGNTAINIMLISRGIFIFIAFFALILYLIFAPQTTILEGANHGVKYFILIGIIFWVGVVGAWVVARMLYKNMYVRKNMP